MAIIKEPHCHFVLLPFMAQGHMIPMFDIARLLASHGALVTILFTPRNANRFKPVTDRALQSGLTIRVVHFNFPSTQTGLPQDCENYDMLTSMDDIVKFFEATRMLKNQIQDLLKHLKPYPNCLISDMCFPWTTNVAVNLKIPRIIFHGTSCFAIVLYDRLASFKDFENVKSDTEYFVVPDLPHTVEINRVKLLGMTSQIPPAMVRYREEVHQAEVEAYGTVVNTFRELETEYVKDQEKKDKHVWCIGPVSLCNEDLQDQAERGNQASIGRDYCLSWLDTQPQGSVIYVCLGSISCVADEQLIELGLGLEASNRPFVWVIRNASGELKRWLLQEKFEEKVKGRGLLIQGWAPQVLILSHTSVGGFLTHCGWNSTLEGIVAGVPMITWPVFAEQFINENFIVSVLKIGIKVGVEIPVIAGEEDKVGIQVNSDKIKVAIEELMGGGEEGEKRRHVARKLSDMARSSIKEGGSSDLSIKRLIHDVTKRQQIV